MGRVRLNLDVLIRPFRDEDEPEVLDLLRTTLGEGPAGQRDEHFFRWKHMQNPFGRSLMLVAEVDSRIVGLRAFLRWRFRCGDRVLRAVQAVDTATHPSYQGRGIFSRLTLRGLDVLRDETDLVFNTPNEKSLPGYLKMGWAVVDRIPVSIFVRRPIRFASAISSFGDHVEPGRPSPSIEADRASDLLPDLELVSDLVARVFAPTDRTTDRLETMRSAEYLAWRYGSSQRLDYRLIAEYAGARLEGLAILRVRPRGRLWETALVELLVSPDNGHLARRLIRRVKAAAAVDHLTCHFPRGSIAARAALLGGFLPSRSGVTLVVNPLGHELGLDPADATSWALSLGDLEVL